MADEPLLFALAIRARSTPVGEQFFAVDSANFSNLPEEVIITLLRHWLKTYEEEFHQQFESRQGQ